MKHRSMNVDELEGLKYTVRGQEIQNLNGRSKQGHRYNKSDLEPRSEYEGRPLPNLGFLEGRRQVLDEGLKGSNSTKLMPPIGLAKPNYMSTKNLEPINIQVASTTKKKQLRKIDFNPKSKSKEDRNQPTSPFDVSDPKESVDSSQGKDLQRGKAKRQDSIMNSRIEIDPKGKSITLQRTDTIHTEKPIQNEKINIKSRKQLVNQNQRKNSSHDPGQTPQATDNSFLKKDEHPQEEASKRPSNNSSLLIPQINVIPPGNEKMPEAQPSAKEQSNQLLKALMFPAQKAEKQGTARSPRDTEKSSANSNEEKSTDKRKKLGRALLSLARRDHRLGSKKLAPLKFRRRNSDSDSVSNSSNSEEREEAARSREEIERSKEQPKRNLRWVENKETQPWMEELLRKNTNNSANDSFLKNKPVFIAIDRFVKEFEESNLRRFVVGNPSLKQVLECNLVRRIRHS